MNLITSFSRRSTLFNALAFVTFNLLGISTSSAQTACAEGESEIIILIVSDAYPTEISWELNVGGEEIAFGASEGDTLCVDMTDEFPCFLFEIHDTYGDGIFDPGGYWIYLNGVEIASGGDYDYGDEVSFDCAPGETCNDAVALDMPSVEGDVISQSGNNFWYTFTPELLGMYDFSSCGSGCDTRLWLQCLTLVNGKEHTIWCIMGLT